MPLTADIGVAAPRLARGQGGVLRLVVLASRGKDAMAFLAVARSMRPAPPLVTFLRSRLKRLRRLRSREAAPASVAALSTAVGKSAVK